MNLQESTGSSEWAMVNRTLVLSESASISIFDRGLLYGDAVFETLPVYNGRIFRLSDHWERLRQSAAAIRLTLPIRTATELQEDCQRLLAANSCDPTGHQSCPVSCRVSCFVLRVTFTRGYGKRGLAIRGSTNGNYIITCYPTESPLRDDPHSNYNGNYNGNHNCDHQNGVHLHVPVIRKFSPLTFPTHAKTANYINNILGLDEAMQSGADDCLLLNTDGAIAECSTSNIFFVIGGRLSTPQLNTGAIAGVTRKVILEIAQKLGLCVEEATLTISELTNTTEAFITNSVSGIRPVRLISGLIDGSNSGSNSGLFSSHEFDLSVTYHAPGEVTQALDKEYRRSICAGDL